MRSCRGTLKLSAGINVLPVKTPRHARFSAIAFIKMVNRWIVVWLLLIRRKIFAGLMRNDKKAKTAEIKYLFITEHDENIFESLEICVILQHENNNNTKLYTATDLSERIAMY